MSAQVDDVPIDRTGRDVRGDLVCGLCTRTAARVEGTWGVRFVPRKLYVRDAEQGEAVRRMRCNHCGGHLTLQGLEVVTARRSPDSEVYRRGLLPGSRPRRPTPHAG